MNIQQLFMMQKELDDFIEQTQNIQQDVFQEKGLALMVELAELANETRCFKFWSTKGPSAREVILEEYVDSIHFILRLIKELYNNRKVASDRRTETFNSNIFRDTRCYFSIYPTTDRGSISSNLAMLWFTCVQSWFYLRRCSSCVY